MTTATVATNSAPPADAPAMTAGLTLPEFLALGPCYDTASILRLAAGRERLTALEILDLPIPAEDRLWAALHPGFVAERILHEFACRSAEAALEVIRARGEAIDPRSTAAVAAKRAWLRGEIDDEQLAAARAAAWAAARDAAWAAARDAARDAAVDRLRALLTA